MAKMDEATRKRVRAGRLFDAGGQDARAGGQRRGRGSADSVHMVQERAVRMVFDVKDQYPSQWAAIESIASKIGCTGETLRKWVRQGERDSGMRPGPTTTEQQRIKELEREVRELRKTNEILKLASAYFAQAEFDRQLKK